MTGWIRPALAAALYGAAGSYLFLELASRRLILIPHPGLQRATLLAAFGVLVPGAAAAGWAVSGSAIAGFAIPVAALALGAAYEGAVALLRRRSRGSHPTRRGPPPRRRYGVTTTDLDVLHYALRLPGWRGRPLRIAHVSDLHVGPALPLAYYQRVWAAVRAERPDVVFMTGDAVTRRRDLPLLPAALSVPEAPLGAFAVLGNHDQWSGGADVAARLRAAGFDVLHNGWRALATADGQPLLVAGCEEPWSADRWRPWPRTEAGAAVLALSHTADTVYRLADAGATAVFAGHYHGGQFRLPLLGAAVLPSRLGRRFVHGHFRVRGTHLFVSAGVGASGPALRIACPPDVLMVEIS